MVQYKRLYKTLLVVSVIMVSSISSAQLEEIVVTAQSREQSLQDVPISVVAVTGDMLLDTNVQKLEDLQGSIPNFTLNETGIATTYFVRGIGSGINQAFEQSVGTYIDGVYYSRAQSSRSPFLDIERVEVLRGPQTILFGKNSIGGAINITTAKPTEEFSGYMRSTHEFANTETAIEGAVSGALTDSTRVRVSARKRKADGHYTNATLNTNEPNRNDTTVRLQLEQDFTENLTANLKWEKSSFDVLGRNLEIQDESAATAGPFAGLQYNQVLSVVFRADASVGNVTADGIRSSNGDFSYNDTETKGLTLNWQLGDFELKSTTAQTSLDYNESCDCDFTGAVIFDAKLQETYDQFSQEFRLTSPADDKLNYIVGFYYQDSEHDYRDQIEVPAGSVLIAAVNAASPGSGNLLNDTEAARIAKVDAEVISVFGQFNYEISDSLGVQLGLRYSEEEKAGSRTMSIRSIDGSALPAAQGGAPVVYGSVFGLTSTNLVNLAGLGLPSAVGLVSKLGTLPVADSFTETQLSPDLKVTFTPNDNAKYYVSFVKGAKAGGFDFRANNKSQFTTMADSFRFNEENAESFELGGKFSLAEGHAEINASLFVTNFSDLQVSVFDGTLGFNVGNAAESTTQGIEVDGRWSISDNLLLTGAVALTDFEFSDYKGGQCNFGQTPDSTTPQGVNLCDYSGKTQAQLADYSGFIGLDYEMGLGALNLNIYGAVEFSGDYFASAQYDPLLVQDAYQKLNMRFSLTPAEGDWEAALLLKNLTDEQVLSFGGPTPLSGSSFGAKSNYAFYQEGRTVALQVGFNF